MVVSEFNDVKDNSRNVFLNPLSCVPLTKIRELSQSGVRRMMRLFERSFETDEDLCSIGICLGSDTPIVVKLTGSLLEFVTVYFREEHGLEQEKQRKILLHERIGMA